MRHLFLILMLVLFAGPACATDFDRPIGTGRVNVILQAAPLNPLAIPTNSVSVRLAAPNLDPDLADAVEVFCVDITAGMLATGDTDPIVNPGAEVFLVGYAHSLPGCAGVRSNPTADRYHVKFNAPDAPTLYLVVPPITP